eukprot:1843975-Prymnesium_polylepis.2
MACAVTPQAVTAELRHTKRTASRPPGGPGRPCAIRWSMNEASSSNPLARHSSTEHQTSH